MSCSDPRAVCMKWFVERISICRFKGARSKGQTTAGGRRWYAGAGELSDYTGRVAGNMPVVGMVSASF